MRVYLEKTIERLNSGKSKTIFRNISCIVIIGLTTIGRKAWQEEEETRKDLVLYWFFRSNLVLPSSSRSFRTQYRWSFITGQCDNSEQLLPAYSPCWMCVQFAFSHQLWINTWRSKFEQMADSILSACGPMDKEHKDPEKIDLSVPRHAQYLHKAWKRHQNTVYWIDINLAITKGLKFSASERYHSLRYTASLFVSRKPFGWKLEESKTKK